MADSPIGLPQQPQRSSGRLVERLSRPTESIGAIADERERLIDLREAAVRAREDLVSARLIHALTLITAAEGRDRDAEGRDRIAEARDDSAELRRTLDGRECAGPDDLDRYASAVDRFHAGRERDLAAGERCGLLEMMIGAKA